MDCSLASREEILQCARYTIDWIVWAKPLVEAGLGLLGLGTIGLLTVLTWHLKNNRRDIVNLQQTEASLRQSAKEAIQAQQEAKESEQTAQANLKLALEQLNAVRGPLDEQHRRLFDENARLQSKLAIVRQQSSGDDTEFWSRPPDMGTLPDAYNRRMLNSIPVILLANQKGGVGKTTLATNLAAYFAKKGERTLLIDLDYQGSATGLMLAQSGVRPDDFPSLVDLFFEDQLNEHILQTAIQRAANDLDYVSCWYSFERLERNLEYRWAVGECDDDIRYRLARIILHPTIQTKYQRIILDAPPRMTTGFINGICASTHLLVPAVLDRVSAVAVGTFARRFKSIRDSCNTTVDLTAIIGTMTRGDTLSDRAQAAAEAADKRTQKALGTTRNYFLQEAHMKQTTQVGYSTEDGIAYLQANRDTRQMFHRIGDAVAQRIPLRRH